MTKLGAYKMQSYCRTLRDPDPRNPRDDRQLIRLGVFSTRHIYKGKWYDTKSNCSILADYRSRYFLPLINLMRRVNKGPIRVHTASVYGDRVALQVGNDITAWLPVASLYSHSTNDLALLVLRSLKQQIKGLETLRASLSKTRTRTNRSPYWK